MTQINIKNKPCLILKAVSGNDNGGVQSFRQFDVIYENKKFLLCLYLKRNYKTDLFHNEKSNNIETHISYKDAKKLSKIPDCCGNDCYFFEDE